MPQTVIARPSGHALTHDFHFHYTAIVLAGVFLATVEAGCGPWATARWVLVAVLVATSVVANVARSPSPLGASTTTASGPGRAPPRHRRAALRVVPPTAGVSASYNLIPHLTHRTYAYEFPNPWQVTNWGAWARTRPTRTPSTTW